ncbi:MAG: DUF1573 domain-containing protein [Phycisphaerales bacterium]|nr:DUF1573 domain-containing protein [Phycisphaerales bacterium]
MLGMGMARKTWFGVMTLLLVAMSPTGAFAQVQLKPEPLDPDAPPFSVGEQPVQLGYIRLDQGLVTTLELHNEGDEPLTIQKIVTGCKCTTIDPMNPVVPAHGSTTLVIEHNPEPYVHGWTKQFRIQTVEKPRNWYSFVCQATCGYAIQLNKGASPRIADVTGNITAESIDQRPFRVLAVQGQPPMLQDFDPVKDEPRNNYVIQYDLGQDAAHGMALPALVIETDHPEAPMIAMTVTGKTLRRVLDAQPVSWRPHEDYLLLNTVEPGGPGIERTFQLQRTRTLPGETPELSIELSGFDGQASPLVADVVRVVPTPDGRGGEFDVTCVFRVKEGAAPGFVENVAVISQGAQFTQLPVFARVAGASGEAPR